MTEAWIASFATAAEDVALRRVQARRVLGEDAQLHTRMLLRTHASALAERSSGLVDFLAGWAEDDLVSHAEALGMPVAQESWRAPGVDPVWAAASSALHLAGAGRRARWEATFVDPLPIRVGSTCTEPVRKVRSEDQQLHVVRQDGSSGTPSGVELDRAQVGPASVLIRGAETKSAFPTEIGVEDISDSTQPIDSIRRTLADALGRLRELAPHYFDWVVEVVHTVIPSLPPSEQGYSSGSATSRPGVIHVSFPISPISLMESLVHEASHQYFHIGQLETLFGNGQDQNLYLNPYIAKNRPIDRILIAFHAFANIVLFYRSCLESGAGAAAQALHDDMVVHMERVREWDRALANSDGLTGDGRLLFETIRKPLFG